MGKLVYSWVWIITSTCMALMVCCIIGIGIFAWSYHEPMHEQAKNHVLLNEVQEKLSEKQSKVFARIKEQKTTVSSMVARFDASALGKTPLELYYKEHGKLVMSNYQQTVNSLIWQDATTRVLLSFHGQSVTGLIYVDNKVFSIEPLGDGLHAVSEINQLLFPKK